MSWAPEGFGYNVTSLLFIGWCVVDILIAVAVYPLLKKRKLIYRLIAWGEAQLGKSSADEELERVRNRGIGP
jgi:hypothetical protein